MFELSLEDFNIDNNIANDLRIPIEIFQLIFFDILFLNVEFVWIFNLMMKTVTNCDTFKRFWNQMMEQIVFGDSSDIFDDSPFLNKMFVFVVKMNKIVFDNWMSGSDVRDVGEIEMLLVGLRNLITMLKKGMFIRRNVYRVFFYGGWARSVMVVVSWIVCFISLYCSFWELYCSFWEVWDWAVSMDNAGRGVNRSGLWQYSHKRIIQTIIKWIW